MRQLDGNYRVTVCSECLRACCWQGEFMCDDARTAATVEKSTEELAELGLEHEEYWPHSAVLTPMEL